jgi:hypothetical protein
VREKIKKHEACQSRLAGAARQKTFVSEQNTLGLTQKTFAMGQKTLVLKQKTFVMERKTFAMKQNNSSLRKKLRKNSFPPQKSAVPPKKAGAGQISAPHFETPFENGTPRASGKSIEFGKISQMATQVCAFNGQPCGGAVLSLIVV